MLHDLPVISRFPLVELLIQLNSFRRHHVFGEDLLLDDYGDERVAVFEERKLIVFAFTESEARRLTSDDPRARLDDATLHNGHLVVLLVNRLAEALRAERSLRVLNELIFTGEVGADVHAGTLTTKYRLAHVVLVVVAWNLVEIEIGGKQILAVRELVVEHHQERLVRCHKLPVRLERAQLCQGRCEQVGLRLCYFRNEPLLWVQAEQCVAFRVVNAPNRGTITTTAQL